MRRLRRTTADAGIDYSSMPLTFEVTKAGTIIFKKNSSGATARSISYTKNGTSSGTLTANSTTGQSISVAIGDIITFTGTNTRYCDTTSTSYYCKFAGTAQFIAYGNIMSLLDADSRTYKTFNSYAFNGLFKGHTGIINAENLVFPAITCSSYCLAEMFSGCSLLVYAPKILPMTSLASYCYRQMFYNCAKLKTSPELPALTLSTYCYDYMFYNCYVLESIKALFTTTPSSTYTGNWVGYIDHFGTFIRNSAATWTISHNNNCIPTYWMVKNQSGTILDPGDPTEGDASL